MWILYKSDFSPQIVFLFLISQYKKNGDTYSIFLTASIVCSGVILVLGGSEGARSDGGSPRVGVVSGLLGEEQWDISELVFADLVSATGVILNLENRLFCSFCSFWSSFSTFLDGLLGVERVFPWEFPDPELLEVTVPWGESSFPSPGWGGESSNLGSPCNNFQIYKLLFLTYIYAIWNSINIKFWN